jgi:hypothetical protein
MTQYESHTAWMYSDCGEPPLHLFQFESEEAMCMDEEDFVMSFYQQRLCSGISQEEELDMLEKLLTPLNLQQEFHEEFLGA